MAEKTTLYLITNATNGKTYVGVTKHRNLRRRLSEHFSVARKNKLNGTFQRALRKYAREDFSIAPIAYFATRAEAFAAEIEYIAAYNPPYNSTLGGEGAKGHKSSEKVKSRNKIVHRGNKYRLGSTHTLEVRKLLKDYGYKNMHIFSKYQKLGPAAQARKVVCLEDNKSYESASAAARHYNVCKSALIEVCLNRKHRKTVGGLRFKYEMERG
jgi:group I intron endonuclease